MKYLIRRRSVLKAAALLPAAALLTGCEDAAEQILAHMLEVEDDWFNTEAALGSCTVRLLSAALEEGGILCARLRVTGLPVQLDAAAACSASLDGQQALQLVQASPASLAASAAAQELELHYLLTAAQRQQAEEKAALRIRLSALGFQVEYLVDCPAMTILPPSVTGSLSL